MNNLECIRSGDYFIPNLILSEQPQTPIGKYGRIRKTYLREHRPALFSHLLLSDKLYSHLLEIDQAANERLAQLMPQIAKAAGITEQLEGAELIKFRLDYWHTKQCHLGVRRLRDKLRKEDGLIVGRKLIRRYMDEMGIYAVYPKPNLSKRGKDFKPFPYLLKNKNIFPPNQVWAVDITYIKMGKSTCI